MRFRVILLTVAVLAANARAQSPTVADRANEAVAAPSAVALAKELQKTTESLRQDLALVTMELEIRNAENRRYRVAAQQANVDLGSVLRDGLWSNGQAIPVCWDSGPADAAAEKQWIRDAISKSWERESAVRFVGWQQCVAGAAAIRITFSDEGPHVKRLGRFLAGVPQGMVLNNTFGSWSRSCAFPESQREFCIRAVAVHEFGHALAFAHEQNRSDAPTDCQKERQGSDGDWNVTLYDPDSVMNYCNLRWNNNGALSPLDIEAVRRLYGNPPAAAAPNPGTP